MSYEVKLVKIDELNLPNQANSVWQDSRWMAAVAHLNGLEPMFVAAYDDGGLCAYLPIYIKHKFGLKRIVNPILSFYHPLEYILPPSTHANRILLRKHDINHALGGFLKNSFKKVRLNLNPDTFDVRGFTWQGLNATPLYTFIYDSSREPELFPEEKRRYRKSLQEGFVFNSHFDPDVFAKIFLDLCKRKGYDFRLKTEQLIKFLVTTHDQGILKQFNLLSNGEIVSSDMLLCDCSDTSYAVLRATSETAKTKNASILHSIKLCESLRELNKKLDFCGANVPGPARFKASFGFELKLFFQINN